MNWKDLLDKTPDCPDLDLLAAGLETGRHRPQDDRLKKHLAECPHCRTELDRFRDFQNLQVLPQEQSDVDWIIQRLESKGSPQPAVLKGRTSWLSRLWTWPYLAPALAAVLAMALILQFFPFEQGAEPRVGSGIVRSVTLEILHPTGDLATVPDQMEWQGVEGAALYRVVILEVDRSALWSGVAQTPRIDFPESVSEIMLPGKALWWQVIAQDREGRRLATSALTPFRKALQPSGPQPQNRFPKG